MVVWAGQPTTRIVLAVLAVLTGSLKATPFSVSFGWMLVELCERYWLDGIVIPRGQGCLATEEQYLAVTNSRL